MLALVACSAPSPNSPEIDAGFPEPVPDALPGNVPGDALPDTPPGPDIPDNAETGGTGMLCTTLGWCRITSTKLRDVCPTPSPGGTCLAVVTAWAGAAADTENNVMYLWGGGHKDYVGNEVYALDLMSLKMKRLNRPSPASAVTECSELYSDGLPSSRHTYGALTFLPAQRQLFAFGGSYSRCGYMGNDTLRFDPMTTTWSRPLADGPPRGSPGIMADYDTATNRVFLHDVDGGTFWSFNPADNTYTRLREGGGVDYRMTGVIDPSRKLFVMMGHGQIRVVSIAPGSNYLTENWDAATTGCDALRNADSPGLTYDPDQNAIVGWAGGTAVYLFDATTRTCTQRTFPGGPGVAQKNGTFGRFRYFPRLKVFAVVNDAGNDAFTLRMTMP